jgi:MoaA/NifB/PqqE/SkfB family radical SAM enzyme
MTSSAIQLPLPKPAAGVEAYDREKELALAYDPRRRDNYRRYQAFRRTGDYLDFLPVKLDIENISRCNFRCTMCQVSDWSKGQRAADMSLDAFEELLDEQYGVIEIKLQGMGEPLLQRDVFFKMIEYARRTNIWVRTTTNASLLHLKENYRKLIDADPNEVQISIDGADEMVFEKIRRGSRFDQVTQNCRLINDYCDARSVIRTKMWVVVQRENQHQLEHLVELAARIGFRCLCFSLTLTGWGQDKWQKDNSRTGGEVLLDTCFELVKQGERLGVDVSFWDIGSKFNTRSPSGLCSWPFERAYVSSDLRVVPCCMIANPEVLDLGDATNFTRTWNGNAYRAFRRAHIDGDIPKPCMACYETKAVSSGKEPGE